MKKFHILHIYQKYNFSESHKNIRILNLHGEFDLL